LNYEVYSFWNIRELEGVFNAIAALTASADFTGLLRLLAMIAIVSLVLAVLSGRARHEDFWRWIIMVALINGMLLVPKSTVLIVDRTGTQPTRVVDNVPIGLAELAHGTSKIGDWLTRAYETVFSLPTDLQFQKRGLMFGQRLFEETQKMSPDISSGTWMKDFQEYWRECVTPDLTSGYLNIDTIRTSQDIWGSIGNTNPALYVTLSTTGTVQCSPNAYNDLTNRLNNQVVPDLINRYASVTFPGSPTANSDIKNGIVTTYAYGLNVSNSAEAIVKQAAMQNAAVQAYCNVFAQAGDSNRAALCYSTSMGAYQTNQTYQVLAQIAESSMPKLKSAIEMIQYAIFPIILAFAIVAGHLGLSVIKAYVMSLVWVQLWPPLYAVVHYMQTIKMQSYADQLGSLANTMAGQIQLINMGVSDQAIAGMLVVAIPPIAAALVKGGEIGLQAVAGLVSAPRTAERQAADTAKGNESVGQWKTSPTVDYAASPTPVMARRNDDGSYGYQNPDGSVTYNVGTALDKASFKVSSSGREVRSLTQQSENAETAAAGNMVSSGKETIAALQQVADFTREHSKGDSASKGVSVEDAAKINQAYSEMQDVTKRFAEKHGISEEKAAQILGSVSTKGGLEVFGSGVTAELKATGESKAAESIAKDKENAFSEAQKFQLAQEKLHQVTSQDKYQHDESAGAKAMRGIKAHLDQAQKYSDQAYANHQKSLAYKELAGHAREGSVTVEQDLTTRVMNRLATERATIDGHAYNGFKREEVDALMRSNIPEMRALVDRIADEETAKLLEEKYGKPKTPQDVRAFFEQGKEGLPTKGDVTEQGEQWLGNVQGAAARAGVDPDKGVTSKLPGQVSAEMRSITQGVAGGKGNVDTGGQPIQGTVTNAVENPGSLALKAVLNASTSVLPQGTTYLLDKVGAAPGSFAQKDAKDYEHNGGTVISAAVDTTIFAGATLLGGPLGGKVGEVLGPVVGKGAIREAEEKIVQENAHTVVGQHYPNNVEIVAKKAGEEERAKLIAAGGRDGVKIGAGAGAIAGNEIADNLDHGTWGPSVLGGAWKQGEQATGDLFSGSPSGSNWESLLGGGQPPTQIQSQSTEGSDSVKKDDTPPPSGR
jgi:conjugal transfer mating pair stabilization protein TraG